MKTIPQQTLGFLLHDSARLLKKRFEQRARADGLELTRSHWQVLAMLARQEGSNQRALAQQMEIEPITLARLLDKLQACGMIERRPDPADRRARVLFLTPEAEPFMERLFALGTIVREEAMAGLSAEQRTLLMDALLVIRTNLSARTQADADPDKETDHA